MSILKLLGVGVVLFILISNISAFAETWVCPLCGQKITAVYDNEVLSHAYGCLNKKFGGIKFDQRKSIKDRIMEINTDEDNIKKSLNSLYEQEQQRQKEIETLKVKLNSNTGISTSNQYPQELVDMENKLSYFSSAITELEKQKILFIQRYSGKTVSSREEAYSIKRKGEALVLNLDRAKKEYYQLNIQYTELKSKYNQSNNTDYEEKQLDKLLAELAGIRDEMNGLKSKMDTLKIEKSSYETLLNGGNK